jgi:hypothetical protein
LQCKKPKSRVVQVIGRMNRQCLYNAPGSVGNQ